MKQRRLAIIGCGNLGRSIAQGILADPDYPNDMLHITRRRLELIEDFRDSGAHITAHNAEAVQQSELLVLTLKPHSILEVLRELSPHLDPQKHIVISCATGISLEQLHEAAGTGVPVYRAMPNTAADVSESLTCICSENGDTAAREPVEAIFKGIGRVVDIKESLMDAATVLGACGIAYVLRFMRAMVQGGIQIGFDAATATAIVNQTVKGASQLLIERGLHPEQEIDKVTTPRGCTIAGLNEMEHHGFSSALIRGLVASFEEIDK